MITSGYPDGQGHEMISKKVAAFGLYGGGNLGDDVYLDVLQRNNCNIQFIPQVEFRSSTIHNVQTRFNRKLRNFLSYESRKQLRKLLDGNANGSRKLTNFDSILLGPGGLVQLTDFKPWCDRMYLALRESRLPLFCYGVGVESGNFTMHVESSEQEYLEKWKRMLSFCDKIYTRDNFSKEVLLANAIHDKIEIINDVAFAYPLPEPKKTSGKYVGINLRSVYIRDVHEVASLIDYLVEMGYEVLLIPFKEREGILEISNDAIIMQQVSKLSKHKDKVRIIKSSSADDTLRYIGSMKFFIGTRYHSVLFALRYGIPTYAISYKPTVKSLMEEYYDLGDYVVAPNQIDRIKELLMDEKKIRAKAISRTPEIEQTTKVQIDSFLNQISSIGDYVYPIR